MAITWSKIDSDNGPSLTIIFEDGHIQNVPGSHPNFKKILAEFALENPGYEDVVRELADTISSVKTRLQRLSEQFTTDGSVVLFDNDPIDKSLSDYILRLLKAENDGEMTNEKVTWRALVAFLEKLYQNPLEASRNSLYGFISRHGLTIRANGDFVAYKGIRDDYNSKRSGDGIVDGVKMNGHLPNKPGSVLEMSRRSIDHDQSNGCGVGLHAGTLSYASWWGERVVAVSINPRDVVSVPLDSDFQKLRTCRYEVLTDVDKKTEARATVGKESKVFWNDDNSEILGTLEDALDNELDVTIDYTSKAGVNSTRTVEVERIDGHNVYTYDHEADQYRTFTINRINSATLEAADEDLDEDEDTCGDCDCEDLAEDIEVSIHLGKLFNPETEDEEFSEMIHDAIDEGKNIRIVYEAQGKPVSTRTVTPINLEDNRLEAHLVDDSSAIRTFLVERINEIEILDRDEDAAEAEATVDVPEILRGVIASRGKVNVTYRSSRGVAAQRLIAPTKIDGDYVHVTLPSENNEYRTLRLDRIQSIG